MEKPLVDKAASFQVGFDRRSLGRETPSQQFPRTTDTFSYSFVPEVGPESGEVLTLLGGEMLGGYEWLLRACKKL